jgi:hypothetical protein
LSIATWWRPLLLLAALAGPAPSPAQDSRDASHYPAGEFNWAFRGRHAEAARLFNAFDYGHGVLYERLLTLDSAGATGALEREYQFLLGDLLVRPPRFGVVEEAIAPSYARLVWPAMAAFDRAHVLHRQLYDVHADTRLPPARQHAIAERLIDAYLQDDAYAFSAAAKSMSLMDDQPFSQRFRREHPAFNGLIWSYHWLQVGLYEPLIAGTDPGAKRAGVDSMVTLFRTMIADPANHPATMPMTAQVAPRFTTLHPRAAAIFDNLHMLHDIISDVLATPEWSAQRKREVILAQLAEMRDATTNLMEEGHEH